MAMDLPGGANAKINQTQRELNPWWQVDLGQQADIQQVNIFNRTSCCLDRLSDFYVFVSDQPFSNSATVAELSNDPQVSNFFFSGQAGVSESISLAATGRYVRIQLNSTNGILHVAEVQVMGCPTGNSNFRLVEEFTQAEALGNEIQIQLRPNPTNQRKGLDVFLQIPKEEPIHLGVYSIDGKKVYTLETQAKNPEVRIHIPLNGMPSGVYLIQAIGNTYDLKKRFIIE